MNTAFNQHFNVTNKNRPSAMAIRATGLALVLCLALSACGQGDAPYSDSDLGKANSTKTEDAGSSNTPHSLTTEKQYPSVQALIEAQLQDSLQSVRAMQTSTAAFVGAPSETSYQTLIDDFTRAYDSYQRSRLALIIGGVSEQYQKRIDAYPILPGYLDSIAGYPSSGLIHSEVPLDAKTLRDEHQFSDAMYLTLGFQPFKFMLEGDPAEPIQTWQRFLVEGTEKRQKAAKRRGEFLQVVSDELLNDIQLEADQWRSTKEIREAYLLDQSALNEYLNTEREHVSAASRDQVKDFWQQLKSALMVDLPKPKDPETKTANSP